MGEITKTVIPIGTSGAEDVVRDLDDIAKAAARAARAADAAQVNFNRASLRKEAADNRAEKLALAEAQAQAIASGQAAPGQVIQMPTNGLVEQQKWLRIAEGMRDAINPLRVAQREYNDEMKVANELLKRNVFEQDEYEAAVERAEAALRRATGAEREAQEAQAARVRYQAGVDALLDKIEPARVAQRELNKQLADAKDYFDRGAISAEQYAAATQQAQQKHDVATGLIDPDASRKAAAEMQRQQAAAQAIRDALDPAARAQREFNTAVAAAKELLESGQLKQAEYDGAVALAEGTLKRATAALREHGSVLGLNRGQYITAQSALLRFSDMVMAGQNPLRAFALEAHKGAEVLAMDEGGMAGGLAKVAGLITPTVVGVAALTTAVLAGGLAAYSYSTEIDKMALAAEGFGRTSLLSGEQLLATAEMHSKAAGISVGAARDIETAILHQTRTSADALGKAIDLNQTFADAMGIDTAKAAQELGAAMADPAKAADTYAASLGALTPEQVKMIHQLMEQNRLTDAQGVLLDGLNKSLDGTKDHVNGLTQAWRWLTSTMSQGWENIGSAISHAMGVYSDAEKLGHLRDEAQRWRGIADSPWVLPGERAIAEKKWQQLQTDIGVEGRNVSDKDRNRTAQSAQDIAAKYGLDATVSPRLESMKQDLAALQQAQKAGVKVDGATVDALHHAIRTFMTPEQQRLATARAQADKDRAKPGTAAYQEAARRLRDAQTAGQVVTDAGAAALGDESARGAAGHGSGANKHAEQLKRDAEAMSVAAAQALKLSEAYLTSGDAAMKAEAQRKAATDATKRGIDIDAQVARQLALDGAQAVAESAKKTRGLIDETDARTRVLEMVRKGTLAGADMDAALSKEAALRPLLAYQTILHGQALFEFSRALAAQKSAIDSALQSERDWGAQQKINADLEAARKAQVLAGLAGERDPVRRARIETEADASAAKVKPELVAQSGDAAATRAGEEQKKSAAEWFADQQHQAQMQMTLIGLQQRYASAKDQGDIEEIRRQQLVIELDRAHISLTAEQIAQVLEMRKEVDEAGKQAARQAAAWQQLREDGAQALDTLLNPDNITHWGDTFKQVLKQILFDLEKLALINPLENALFGGERATLGGKSGGGGSGLGGLLTSILGGLFGKSSSGTGTSPAITANPEWFADGTQSAPGGWAVVGERGKELVKLPRGAGVLTASRTRTALADSGSGQPVQVNLTLDARGAGPREVETLQAQVDQLRREFPAIAVQAVANARQRRVIG